MGRGEFLLEVRAEEIPARMLEPGVRELSTRLFEELMARAIGPSEIETGFTPRRLVLILNGLPEREPDREEAVMGPPVRAAFGPDGAPTQALLGFAKRTGLEPDQLTRVQTDKGEYLAASKKIAGRPTGEVLAELVPRILAGIAWPKTMRWGRGTGPWVRPIHGIVALLDGEVVPFELFGIAAGRTTAGHPILSPQAFEVAGAEDYRSRIAALGLEVRPEVRYATLGAAMRQRAEALGGRLVEDPVLLQKLAAICEIPGVMEGSFEERFLGLPAEVLATSLRDHQSALTVEAIGVSGRLLPCFLTVMDRADDPAGRARSGNEWVVAARLADAQFFYDEDRKVGLARRCAQLDRLAFHERLGSYAAKADRVEALAERICDQLGWSEERPDALAAARLLKADLATDMVKEFTSLQGQVGGIYAREEGHSEAVWQAVYDQYLPASTEDALPRGRVGRVVGLADRLDTLVGIFGLGLVPTGSKDPFGLRRAAQGAVRIALEGGMAVDFEALARAAVALFGDKLKRQADEILDDLRPFLDDRVRYILGLAGYAHDEIEAALAAGSSDLPDLQRRVDALHRVRGEANFLTVVQAAKRIANITKGAEHGGFDAALFVEPAEKDLAAAFETLRAEIDDAASAGDYDRCLRRVVDLAPVLDRFFVEVLVMAEDEAVRRNRLALLQAIGRSVSRTAKLSEVVVDKAEGRKGEG